MTKILSFLLILSICLSVQSEDDEYYSVYFNLNHAHSIQLVKQVDKIYHNTFELQESENNQLRVAAGDQLIIDDSGIYIAKNKLLSISRTEIRENSQYNLRNGYLHGVLDNDSVMVALDGEQYYFLIPSKSYLFEAENNRQELYKGFQTGEYLIFQKESNHYYSMVKLSIKSGTVELSELDFDQNNFDFRSVTNTLEKVNEELIYYLSPNEEEWRKILTNCMVYDTYIKP